MAAKLQPSDSSSHVSKLWQRPYRTAPALDLTGKITKLEEHCAKVGGFSDVYKCRYTTPNGVKEVAVKAFRFHFKVAEKTSKADKMVHRELEIWRGLRHHNIVPFLGFVRDFGRHGSTSLVSEWMPNGTLDDFCAQYDDQLMLAHRLRLLLDIANGLSYLHLLPIVHGDLSCTNVLIDHNFNACLTDFGLASMIGDIPEALRHLQMTSMRPGAIRWSAPEQFSVDANVVAQRTTKSDIYSFGNLSLLTLSGKHPWSEVQLDIAVILRLHQGDKPDRPTSRAIEDQHWEFIERCWSKVDERPHTEDAVTSVKMFLDSCLPVKPLRHFLCIPIGSPEPLNAPPDSGSEKPKLVRFGETNQYYPALPRKPSWHGDVIPGFYSPIQSTPELKRRRSLDGHAVPQEHASPWPDTLPHFQIHPLLSGEAPRINIYLDLASPSFSLHPGSGPRSIAIRKELRNHATSPPITRIRITHDSIPQWPIDLGINNDQTLSNSHSPITVYDVLYSIYLSLRQQTTHFDWAKLGQHEETGIARAYTQRCRRVPSLADKEASRGVRRIDYLLENHIFGGLVKTHDEDFLSLTSNIDVYHYTSAAYTFPTLWRSIILFSRNFVLCVSMSPGASSVVIKYQPKPSSLDDFCVSAQCQNRCRVADMMDTIHHPHHSDRRVVAAGIANLEDDFEARPTTPFGTFHTGLLQGLSSRSPISILPHLSDSSEEA